MRRWRTDGFSPLRRAIVVLVLLGALAAISFVAHAETLAVATSSFSQERLKRVGDYVRNEVATGSIPGAVLLIQQHG